jgi:hypothetical protein
MKSVMRESVSSRISLPPSKAGPGGKKEKGKEGETCTENGSFEGGFRSRKASAVKSLPAGDQFRLMKGRLLIPFRLPKEAGEEN